ncbi:hypothetical protein EVAR_67474_1 [Eumeta japonica]|uniref:Uncharacterized protein n=1 Tax=Eumeta variegata TaxID=151549 RepID=A0A4C1Z9A9_EUMVA|nr:hypothetical protein EVAR_67474_1 [Eumeta japonica]
MPGPLVDAYCGTRCASFVKYVVIRRRLPVGTNIDCAFFKPLPEKVSDDLEIDRSRGRLRASATSDKFPEAFEIIRLPKDCDSNMMQKDGKHRI